MASDSTTTKIRYENHIFLFLAIVILTDQRLSSWCEGSVLKISRDSWIAKTLWTKMRPAFRVSKTRDYNLSSTRRAPFSRSSFLFLAALMSLSYQNRCKDNVYFTHVGQYGLWCVIPSQSEEDLQDFGRRVTFVWNASILHTPLAYLASHFDQSLSCLTMLSEVSGVVTSVEMHSSDEWEAIQWWPNCFAPSNSVALSTRGHRNRNQKKLELAALFNQR